MKNNNENIVFDFPIIKKIIMKFPQIKNQLFQQLLGYIHPTSCISIRRKYSDELFDKVINDKFSDIWLDKNIIIFNILINITL